MTLQPAQLNATVLEPSECGDINSGRSRKLFEAVLLAAGGGAIGLGGTSGSNAVSVWASIDAFCLNARSIFILTRRAASNPKTACTVPEKLRSPMKNE
ncbi:hypothetical protein BraRD5C2_07440 [Bradyrhizobium sp. RD5-C2]|nr:hypothetical protein BraRD5C2_07440 [Bradyrhizobium sp. RD5-C2]